MVFKSLGLPINIQVLGSRIVVLWRKKLGEKLITRYVTDYNARISPFGFIYHGLPHHSKSNCVVMIFLSNKPLQQIVVLGSLGSWSGCIGAHRLVRYSCVYMFRCDRGSRALLRGPQEVSNHGCAMYVVTAPSVRRIGFRFRTFKGK